YLQKEVHQFEVHVGRARLKQMPIYARRLIGSPRLQVRQVPAISYVQRMCVRHVLEAVLESLPHPFLRPLKKRAVEYPLRRCQADAQKTLVNRVHRHSSRPGTQELRPCVRASEFSQKTGQNNIHLLLEHTMVANRSEVRERKQSLGAPGNRPTVLEQIRAVPGERSVIQPQALSEQTPITNVPRFRVAKGESRNWLVVSPDGCGHRPAIVPTTEENAYAMRPSHAPFDGAIQQHTEHAGIRSLIEPRCGLLVLIDPIAPALQPVRIDSQDGAGRQPQVALHPGALEKVRPIREHLERADIVYPTWQRIRRHERLHL